MNLNLQFSIICSLFNLHLNVCLYLWHFITVIIRFLLPNFLDPTFRWKCRQTFQYISCYCWLIVDCTFVFSSCPCQNWCLSDLLVSFWTWCCRWRRVGPYRVSWCTLWGLWGITINCYSTLWTCSLRSPPWTGRFVDCIKYFPFGVLWGTYKQKHWTYRTIKPPRASEAFYTAQ